MQTKFPQSTVSTAPPASTSNKAYETHRECNHTFTNTLRVSLIQLSCLQNMSLVLISSLVTDVWKKDVCDFHLYSQKFWGTAIFFGLSLPRHPQPTEYPVAGGAGGAEAAFSSAGCAESEAGRLSMACLTDIIAATRIPCMAPHARDRPRRGWRSEGLASRSS